MATFEHTFTWIGEGATVIATGTFDDWTSSLPLTKNEDGKLSATTQLPSGQKILYKYVVDGNWQHNPNEAHEADESGNMNNVFTAPEAVVETPVAIVAVPIVETAAVEEPAKVEEAAVVVVAAPVVEVPEVVKVEEPVAVVEEAAKVEEPVSVVEEPVKAAMSYASAAAAGASVAAAAIAASVVEAVKPTEETATKEVDATAAPAVETGAPVAEATKLEQAKEEDDSYLGAATAGLGAVVAGATVVAGKALEAGHEAKAKALAVAEEARVAAHALAEEKKAEALAQAEVLKAQAKAYQAQAVEATTKAVDSGKAAVSELPFGASALKALGLQDEAPVVTPSPATPVVLNEPSANTLPSNPESVIIPLTAPDADVIVPNGLPVVAPATADSAPATPPKDAKKFGTFGRRQPSVSAAAAAGAEGEQPVRTRKPSFFQKLFGKE